MSPLNQKTETNMTARKSSLEEQKPPHVVWMAVFAHTATDINNIYCEGFLVVELW